MRIENADQYYVGNRGEDPRWGGNVVLDGPNNYAQLHELRQTIWQRAFDVHMEPRDYMDLRGIRVSQPQTVFPLTEYQMGMIDRLIARQAKVSKPTRLARVKNIDPVIAEVGIIDGLVKEFYTLYDYRRAILVYPPFDGKNPELLEKFRAEFGKAPVGALLVTHTNL